MSYLAFFLVLHISAYSIRCLLSPFPAISRCFVIRARVGDDILDLCGLLIALATFDALCWIMSVMVLLMVSISSSSCSVANRFLNSSWNSIFFDPISIASTLGRHFFPFHLYVQFDVAHNQSVVTSSVDLVDDCYVSNDAWPVCWEVVSFGLRCTVSAFPHPSPACFLLEHGIHDFVLSCCCPFYQGVAFFLSQSEPKFARCRFHRICSFPYLSIEVSHHYRVVVRFPYSLIDVEYGVYIYIYIYCALSLSMVLNKVVSLIDAGTGEGKGHLSQEFQWGGGADIIW